MDKLNRNPKIQLGKESVSYQMETKKSLDIEILILNLLMTALILAFSFGLIVTPIFFVLFHMIGVRSFIAGHDRMHTNHKVRFGRILESLFEGFAIVVTPWDEPYDSVKRKHIAHHISHAPGKHLELDSRKDPHSLYESSVVIASFSCLFFEEVQLFLDVRDNKLSMSRLYRLMVYLPILTLYIYYFGWMKYLMVFLAMRITGASSYFIFSWLSHRNPVYNYRFSSQIPKWMIQVISLLLGQRVSKGIINHPIHHAWPGVPYNQLEKIAKAIRENPISAPLMLPNNK